MVPMVVFLVRVPSLPGLFQCHVNLGAGGPRGLETEEPVSPLPLPLAAQGRPCIAGLLVVEAKAEEGGVT